MGYQSFTAFWVDKNHVKQVFFILIILYSVSSIGILSLAPSVAHQLPGAYLNPVVLIGFMVISFLLSILISVYHISVMARMKKRKEDWEPAAKS